MISYIVVFGIGIYLGIKFNKAYGMLKITKDIKYIEKVVEKVLSKESIKIIETKKERQKEKQNKEQEEEDFREFQRFKKMQMESEI